MPPCLLCMLQYYVASTALVLKLFTSFTDGAYSVRLVNTGALLVGRLIKHRGDFSRQMHVGI